jgi:hypothetical protein
MAIKAISDLLATKKDVKQQIFLGVTYRVVSWVREGYVTLAQRDKIEHKELSKNPFALNWEKIACVFAARDSIGSENCYSCGRTNGIRHCRCRTLVAVNQEFREELEALGDVPPSSVPPLPKSEHVKFFAGQAK